MENLFDFFSLFAIIICIQTLWQIYNNWSSFWDERVTSKDRELALRLSVFFLLPIGILLHEIGHSLATWQVGGTVTTFQWRFYWGYIIASGNFSPPESWWISFSGNLVSIFIGLLPIPFIPYIQKRIIGEILYAFVCAELVYSLIWYPLISFASLRGDWLTIYDFSIQPYASITAISHAVLLWILWQLYNSKKAIYWRLTRNKNSLEQLKELESNVTHRPDDLQVHLELAHFLLQNDEVRASKKVAKKFLSIASNNIQVKIFKVSLDCSCRAYNRAIRSGQKLLANDLPAEDQLLLCRILCFSLCNTRRLPEALSYADQGLNIDPLNFKIRCYRAMVHKMLGQHEEAIKDFNIALENAPDENSHKQLKHWEKYYRKEP